MHWITCTCSRLGGGVSGWPCQDGHGRLCLEEGLAHRISHRRSFPPEQADPFPIAREMVGPCPPHSLPRMVSRAPRMLAAPSSVRDELPETSHPRSRPASGAPALPLQRQDNQTSSFPKQTAPRKEQNLRRKSHHPRGESQFLCTIFQGCLWSQ